MFKSFDEQAFWKAIQDKDYLSLKVNTVSTIRNDPTFARDELKKVLEVLHKEVPEIFEEECRHDYEEYLEPDQWDKRYFTKLTYWFQKNFAESRLDYIKKVGRAVHQDTERIYNDSIRLGGSTPNPDGEPTEDPSGNPSEPPTGDPPVPPIKPPKFPFVELAAVVLVLVVIVALLVKLLNR